MQGKSSQFVLMLIEDMKDLWLLTIYYFQNSTFVYGIISGIWQLRLWAIQTNTMLFEAVTHGR